MTQYKTTQAIETLISDALGSKATASVQEELGLAGFGVNFALTYLLSKLSIHEDISKLDSDVANILTDAGTLIADLRGGANSATAVTSDTTNVQTNPTPANVGSAGTF